MIVFEPIQNGDAWHGEDWTVTSDDELADLVARVAIGQYRNVQSILKGTDSTVFAPTLTQIEGAIRLLTADDPENPWHRDGWVFQVISWIAACLQDPKSLKSPPQMIKAHKGFDSLHLRLDEQGERVEFVVVCEEKATTSPRNKIRTEVWPEFRALEAGKRDNELVAEITSVLSQNSEVDPDEAIQELLWKNARAYRVSITIGE